MLNSMVHGFEVEYPSEYDHYDDFDEYLRTEFAQRHPGWEPRFGRVTYFDPIKEEHDYKFLLSGNVPAATSAEDAEGRLQKLLDEVHRDFKAHRPHLAELPAPIARVWRWKDRSGSTG